MGRRFLLVYLLCFVETKYRFQLPAPLRLASAWDLPAFLVQMLGFWVQATDVAVLGGWVQTTDVAVRGS